MIIIITLRNSYKVQYFISDIQQANTFVLTVECNAYNIGLYELETIIV